MKNIIPILMLSCIFLNSCKKKDYVPPGPSPKIVLGYVGGQLIPSQWSDTKFESLNLKSSCFDLKKYPDKDALLTAQKCWFETRKKWNLCQAMMFGPASTDSIFTKIDTWPIDTSKINAVIVSGADFTDVFIDSLPPNMKGFHCVEYLLFKKCNENNINQVDQAILNYIYSVSNDVYLKVAFVSDAWENYYLTNFNRAGSGSTVYATEQAAFLEILRGISNTVDEISNRKIKIPFDALDSMLEASPYTRNTWNDIIYNMNSIFTVYSARDYGISSWVVRYDKALDTKINDQIHGIYVAFDAFKEPLGQSIFINSSAITVLQTQLSQFQRTIEDELVPFVQSHVN